MCIRHFKVSKITFIHIGQYRVPDGLLWSISIYNEIFFLSSLFLSFSYKNFYLTKPSIPLSQSIEVSRPVLYITILFFFVSFGLTFFFVLFSCFANKLMVAVCWKILFNYFIFFFRSFVPFFWNSVRDSLYIEAWNYVGNQSLRFNITKCKVITLLPSP